MHMNPDSQWELGFFYFKKILFFSEILRIFIKNREILFKKAKRLKN